MSSPHFTLHLSCLSALLSQASIPCRGLTVSSPAPAPLLFVPAPSQLQLCLQNGGVDSSHVPRSAALCTYESLQRQLGAHTGSDNSERWVTMWNLGSDPWQGARTPTYNPLLVFGSSSLDPDSRDKANSCFRDQKICNRNLPASILLSLNVKGFPVLMAIFLLTCWTTCRVQRLSDNFLS